MSADNVELVRRTVTALARALDAYRRASSVFTLRDGTVGRLEEYTTREEALAAAGGR